MFEFAKEIKEQPEALQQLIDNIPLTEKSIARLPFKVSRVAFFGMGSSLYSTIPAVYLLRLAGINAEYYDASEALWYLSKKWFNNVDVCVLVSQSGETIEIHELLDKISDSNTIKLAITANVESYLGTNSDITLDIFSGEEKSVGSTKTHINSVLTSIVFSLVLSNSLKNEIKYLQKLPSTLNSCILKASSGVEKLLEHDLARQFDGSVITSRGFALGEVYQSALTLNEIARVNLFPISAGMLRHGPMELFVDKRGLTCFVPDSKNKYLLSKLCKEISESARFVWIISNSLLSLTDDGNAIFNDSLESDLPEYLQSLLFLPYVQILACKLREEKKIGDSEFHLINKVTTEE